MLNMLGELRHHVPLPIGLPATMHRSARSGCSVSLCFAALTTATEHVFGDLASVLR